MRVLIADDDPAFLQFLESTLRGRTDHELFLVNDGQAALARALAAPTPDLIILDWMMPRLNGTQVCRLLRARLPQVYVLLATARGRREEVLECLNAGADEVLTKPVAPDLLVAKVQRAERRAQAGHSADSRIREALAEGSAEGDGELVVRGTSLTARVFFHSGSIAWVDVSDDSPSFLHSLISLGVLDIETARGIVEECRRNNASLADVVVQWGTLSREDLRMHLGGWMRGNLARLLSWTDARAMFLPDRRRYDGGMLFALDEVVPEVVPDGPPEESLDTSGSMRAESASSPSLIPPNEWEQAFVLAAGAHPGVEHVLDRCMACDGVMGIAAFERGSGYCLGRRGMQLDADVAWAHIAALNAVMRTEPVLDCVVSTDRRFHLVLMMPGDADAFLYALIDATRVRIAMARLSLQQAAATDPLGE